MPYPNKFKKSLEHHNVDSKIIAKIFDGYEELEDKSPKKIKKAFFTRAMQQMDDLFDDHTRYQIIDWCACSKSGKRDKDIKKLAKTIKDKPLHEKVKALWQVENMGNPLLNEDGTITTGIYYQVDDSYKCACPCLHNEPITEPISSTYCLCCAGHFRYHYQNALGVKLKTKNVISSPLASLGKEPCVFEFEILA